MQFAPQIYAALTLAFGSPLQEHWWWHVGDSGDKNDHVVVFIDKESIKVDGADTVTFDEDDVKEKPTTDVIMAKHAVIKVAMQCKNSKMQYISAKTFNTSGKMIDQRLLHKPSDPFVDVLPQTVAGDELRFVCTDISNDPRFYSVVGDPVIAADAIFKNLDAAMAAPIGDGAPQ